jgi:hypothetical protein
VQRSKESDLNPNKEKNNCNQVAMGWLTIWEIALGLPGHFLHHDSEEAGSIDAGRKRRRPGSNQQATCGLPYPSEKKTVGFERLGKTSFIGNG